MSRQDICSSNVNETIEQLKSCLKTAVKASVPIKTLTLKDPKRRVSGQVLQCLKRVKSTYNEWRQAGKPKSGHLFLENKLAKRCLRSQQRREEVTRRKSFFDSLMEISSPKIFYKLIRKSKSNTESNTACIQVQDTKYFDPVQQRKCFSQYYEDLSTSKDLNYDNVFLELCNVRCAEAETEYSSCLESEPSLSESEVDLAIDKLNNGKAAGEYGLSAEHLKAAKPVIVPIITQLFNQNISEKKDTNVPDSFKTGIVTPVLKNGKDSKIMVNYKGITVSSALGKLFEYLTN